ncbi:MAG: CRISPR-associated ring nuclease [Anaerolineae bacterium]|nr:CRISPR-associated ring nuclease [Anaerolineae bacterium]
MPEFPATLIVPLGSKAQLITLALDCLRLQSNLPQSLLVVHTRTERPATASALERLKQDLPEHYPHLNFKTLELAHKGLPLQDVTAPDEVEAAFHVLYAEVRALKLQEERVHLLISGGRRTLTVFGMAVAQMLFDDDDHLWHLASHPALEESGNLHAGSGEWARLIPIPLIPWGRLSPVFDALREVDNPFDAADRLGQLRLREQWDLARIFILTKVSPAELAVIELLARDGLNQNEIAERLTLSPRTVEQHLRSVYRKATEHWQVEDINQTQLVRLVMPFWRF